MSYGRNSLCPCGSNKKYKKCCLLKEQILQDLQEEQWHAWFKKDIAQGEQNLKDAPVPPVVCS